MATRDTYTKVHEEWKDRPDKTTPVLAEDLKHIEQGISDAMNNRSLKEIYGDTYMNLQKYGHSSIKTTGEGSLVHGEDSCAPNTYSYAGGYALQNTGSCAHAEGQSNTINGGYGSHVEGYQNTTNGSDYAHVEGQNNTLNGNVPGSHIEGDHNVIYLVGSTGKPIHVEGSHNDAKGAYTHIEGYYNEEYITSNIEQANHIEGAWNKLYAKDGYGYRHIEGYSNRAGESSMLSDRYIHLEGWENLGCGMGSHIEGYSNEERVSSGGSCTANHIEGGDNVLNGNNTYVHVSGYNNTSNGSFAGALFGNYNILSGEYQFVCGKYNEADYSKAFIIGGGSPAARKNIMALDWQGNTVFAGNVVSTYNNRTISLYGLQMELEGRFNALIQGITPAKVFDTKAELDEWLAVEGNPETLKVGQNIYIVETGTPDYWWDGTGLQLLETDKVEIESLTYDETMAILNATDEEVA